MENDSLNFPNEFPTREQNDPGSSYIECERIENLEVTRNQEVPVDICNQTLNWNIEATDLDAMTSQEVPEINQYVFATEEPPATFMTNLNYFQVAAPNNDTFAVPGIISARVATEEAEVGDLGRNYRMMGQASGELHYQEESPKKQQNKKVQKSSKIPKAATKEKAKKSPENLNESFSLGKHYRLGGAITTPAKSTVTAEDPNQSFSLGRNYRMEKEDQPTRNDNDDSGFQNDSARDIEDEDEDLNQTADLGRSYRMAQPSPKTRETAETSKEPFYLGNHYRTPQKKTTKSLLPKPTRDATSTPQRNVQVLGTDYRLNDMVSKAAKKGPLQKRKQHGTEQHGTQSEAYLLGKTYRLGGFLEDYDDPLNDVSRFFYIIRFLQMKFLGF